MFLSLHYSNKHLFHNVHLSWIVNLFLQKPTLLEASHEIGKMIQFYDMILHFFTLPVWKNKSGSSLQVCVWFILSPVTCFNRSIINISKKLVIPSKSNNGAHSSCTVTYSNLELIFIANMIKLLLVIGSVQAMKLEFSKPESILNEDNVILMGITLINIKNETNSWNLFSENLVPMINSLLYFSPNTRIHFIVVTDKNTLEGISSTKNIFLESSLLVMYILWRKRYYGSLFFL